MNPERCDRRILPDPTTTTARPSRLSVAQMYTRADAITDRLLIEIPPSLIHLYRLPWPVAVTAQAWADVIAWPTTAQQARPGQMRHESEEGRLFDVLFIAKTSHGSRPRHIDYPFTIWRVPPATPAHRRRPVRLVLSLHEGDHGETVATIAHRPPSSRWWLPHLYAAAGTAVVLALSLGLALAVLTGH